MKDRLFGSRRRKVASLLAVGVLALGGTAFATWFFGGSGNSTGSFGSASNLVVSEGSLNGDLYPGGTGSLSVYVDNPNGFPAHVVSATLTGPAVSDSPGTCPSSNIIVDVGSVITLDRNIDSHENGAEVVIPDAVSAPADVASGCQNASFKVPVDLAAETP